MVISRTRFNDVRFLGRAWRRGHPFRTVITSCLLDKGCRLATFIVTGILAVALRFFIVAGLLVEIGGAPIMILLNARLPFGVYRICRAAVSELLFTEYL